jgi:anthranilate synthase/aminodeoxychorismate synthase-like glutamine amidotransferase
VIWTLVLLIDNYDSFVYNLARYVRELGEDAQVRRNDELTLDDVARLAPSHIILSPGPCTPAESGISIELVRRFGPEIPILGVCLGHQCIGAAYGGDGRP